jgi:hypothetical protein
VASGVLNDPLSELAATAAALTRAGAVSESVRIWLEPASVHLQFDAFEDSDTVEVSLFDEERLPRFASASLSRALVVAELIGALEAFAAKLPRTDAIEGWNVFPSRELRDAKAGQASSEARLGFLLPWRPIEHIDRIQEEVLLELGKRHELSGVSFTLRGVNENTDEYLVELHTGPEQFAVLGLDWSQRARKLMPATLFKNFEEWRALRMVPDSASEDS